LPAQDGEDGGAGGGVGSVAAEGVSEVEVEGFGALVVAGGAHGGEEVAQRQARQLGQEITLPQGQLLAGAGDATLG
jgi:hypothetical protein